MKNFNNEIALNNFIELLENNNVELWDKTYDYSLPFHTQLWTMDYLEDEEEKEEAKLINTLIKDILNNHFDFESVDLIGFIKKHNLVERTIKGDYWKEAYIASFDDEEELKEEIEYDLGNYLLNGAIGNKSIFKLLKNFVYNK